MKKKIMRKNYKFLNKRSKLKKQNLKKEKLIY